MTVIGRNLRNQDNCFKDINKTLIKPHIEYFIQVWTSVSRHGSIEMGGHRKKTVTKLIKRVQFQGESRDIRTNYLTKKSESDRYETFKITNGISNYGRHFVI